MESRHNFFVSLLSFFVSLLNTCVENVFLSPGLPFHFLIVSFENKTFKFL